MRVKLLYGPFFPLPPPSVYSREREISRRRTLERKSKGFFFRYLLRKVLTVSWILTEKYGKWRYFSRFNPLLLILVCEIKGWEKQMLLERELLVAKIAVLAYCRILFLSSDLLICAYWRKWLSLLIIEYRHLCILLNPLPNQTYVPTYNQLCQRC